MLCCVMYGKIYWIVVFGEVVVEVEFKVVFEIYCELVIFFLLEKLVKFV